MTPRKLRAFPFSSTCDPGERGEPAWGVAPGGHSSTETDAGEGSPGDVEGRVSVQRRGEPGHLSGGTAEEERARSWTQYCWKEVDVTEHTPDVVSPGYL